MKTGVKKIVDSLIISKPEDGLIYLRERLFVSVVLVTLVLGSAAYVMSVYNTIRIHSSLLFLVSTSGYIIMYLIVFGKKWISLKNRIYSFVYLSLFLGIIFLFIAGPEGSGFLYIVGFNILSAVFLGMSSVFFSFIVTSVVLFVITFIVHFNIIPNSPIHLYGTFQFVNVGINSLVIVSISIILAILVDNLGKIFKHKTKLQKLLHDKIDRLSEAKMRAEESDMLKSSFLANMSHEIRTPMNAIVGFSDLVLNQPDITISEAKEYVKTINGSGEYLMNIIGNILDVSLIDTKQLKVSKSIVNISSVFTDLTVLYDPKVKANKGVSLIFTNPPKYKEIIFSTDEYRLKQVLINLINNAFKFTKDGEINVGFTIKKSMIEFYVRDTGIGIKNEQRSKIFDRFVKAEQDEKVTKAKGTGLGLAISKGIVEVLGGKIWVKSTLGKGAAFYFTIPFDTKPI